MREIKFRGWHVTARKMFSAEEMANDQLTILTTGQFINVHGDKTHLSTIYPTDKFIPLQFIGLKDKNENDIYEGDILKIENAHHDGWENEGDVFSPEIKSDVISEVTFYEGAFQFYYEEDSLVPIFGYSEDAEIIGNIYENPELL